MIYEIEYNEKLVDKARAILSQEMPEKIIDKIARHDDLNKLLNEIFAYKDKWFKKATEYLEKYPYEQVSIILEPTIEDKIEQIFKQQREMFSTKSK